MASYVTITVGYDYNEFKKTEERRDMISKDQDRQTDKQQKFFSFFISVLFFLHVLTLISIVYEASVSRTPSLLALAAIRGTN